MGRLICTECEHVNDAKFGVKAMDCDRCGALATTAFNQSRSELRQVSEKRQAANVAKGKPANATPSRRQPDRDWSAARAKVEAEGCCRVCGVDVLSLLVAAHTIGRECDRLTLDGEPVSTKRWPVEPDRIVTLCRSRGEVKGCHEQYDDHELSILSVLHLHEQVQAVEDAGGIELARKRLSPTDYEGGVARRLAA